MPFETKNGSTSILYDRESHEPLGTYTHVSINNAEPFQVVSNSAVPRHSGDNPRDSRYKFSLRPPFLKPWFKRDPGKNGVRKPSCFSDIPTFLTFVQYSLSRDCYQGKTFF
jgi:hypothetical protein